MLKRILLIAALVLAGCGETQPPPNPTYKVGDMVVHRASGERGVVVHYYCRARGCSYQVANRIEKQTWCSEIELQRAKE